MGQVRRWLCITHHAEELGALSHRAWKSICGSSEGGKVGKDRGSRMCMLALPSPMSTRLASPQPVCYSELRMALICLNCWVKKKEEFVTCKNYVKSNFSVHR